MTVFTKRILSAILISVVAMSGSGQAIAVAFAEAIRPGEELRRQTVLTQLCREGLVRFGPFKNLAKAFNCRTDQQAECDRWTNADAHLGDCPSSTPHGLINSGTTF